jgi:hypothetical protein
MQIITLVNQKGRGILFLDDQKSGFQISRYGGVIKC